MDDGLCRQVDGELFFPEPGGSGRDAKKACALCKVTADCLDYALTNGIPYGIYGGLSAHQRKKLLRGKAAA